MAWNLAMQAKGLAKTAVCAACCFGTVVGYIPFVVGAAIFTVGVAATAGGDGGGAALIAAGVILASPALFAGEALAGVAQFAIGKPISIASAESINHVKAAIGFGPKEPEKGKEASAQENQKAITKTVIPNSPSSFAIKSNTVDAPPPLIINHDHESQRAR